MTLSELVKLLLYKLCEAVFRVEFVQGFEFMGGVVPDPGYIEYIVRGMAVPHNSISTCLAIHLFK